MKNIRFPNLEADVFLRLDCGGRACRLSEFPGLREFLKTLAPGPGIFTLLNGAACGRTQPAQPKLFSDCKVCESDR